MFLTEVTDVEKNNIISFFTKNKYLVISDILKGRGRFAAEWILVIRKSEVVDWVLKPINIVINYYSSGDIKITGRGSLKIGKITMQRKGGDAGRASANMLQFKIDPTELFDLD